MCKTGDLACLPAQRTKSFCCPDGGEVNFAGNMGVDSTCTGTKRCQGPAAAKPVTVLSPAADALQPSGGPASTLKLNIIEATPTCSCTCSSALGKVTIAKINAPSKCSSDATVCPAACKAQVSACKATFTRGECQQAKAAAAASEVQQSTVQKKAASAEAQPAPSSTKTSSSLERCCCHSYGPQRAVYRSPLARDRCRRVDHRRHTARLMLLAIPNHPVRASHTRPRLSREIRFPFHMAARTLLANFECLRVHVTNSYRSTKFEGNTTSYAPSNFIEFRI